jgi:large subunit ribosomal protein L24
MEAPIHLSKVALVCSHCDEWTRVGFSDADGVKARVCRRCGEVID